MQEPLKLVVRLLLVIALLLIGLYLIYGFAAGYFSIYGIGLPSPLNLVVAGILLAIVLYLVLRILLGPRQRS